MLSLILALQETPKTPLIIEPEPVAIVEPAEHLVSEGETLYKIAEEHDTTIQRLFDKNTEIVNPDDIDVGIELVIPEPDEALELRPIPEPVIVPVVAKTAAVSAVRSSRAGNPAAGWYPYGQCTHYISTQRSVGNWNNASEWVWQARRDGYATGSTPRVGAIAQRGNHVALVERIDGNRVYLSESNYAYSLTYSERWANASDFRYIY